MALSQSTIIGQRGLAHSHSPVFCVGGTNHDKAYYQLTTRHDAIQRIATRQFFVLVAQIMTGLMACPPKA